ncbi:DUF883 family protein [Govanella unica]|uniref:DUF883 domain-containing protein n=1 Tax=Govanella unica TaxID=2975056 RepID=A0A9X3TVY8_9PROT|nr:hypothetical protein [Govania unica]MDA5193025.1 hypothetical protein [Govania unica]
MADTASNSTDSRYASMEDEVTKLKAEMSGLTESLSKIAKGATGIASEKMHDQFDRVTKDAKAALGATQKKVSEHPMASIALAVGFGVLLGQLLRR